MKTLIFTLLSLAFFGCNKSHHWISTVTGEKINGTLITKSQYGSECPFKRDSLYLFRGDKDDVYVERQDTVYAINSIASDKGDLQEVSSYQMWYFIVNNPSAEQIKARKEIERLSMKQPVNQLNRR